MVRPKDYQPHYESTTAYKSGTVYVFETVVDQISDQRPLLDCRHTLCVRRSYPVRRRNHHWERTQPLMKSTEPQQEEPNLVLEAAQETEPGARSRMQHFW